MVVLPAIDRGLRTAEAPNGIVSFEVAGGDAAAMLAAWSAAQRADALLLQGLDYLFLVVYSTALASAGCLVARRCARAAPRLAGAVTLAAWAATLAGVADAIENAPLILMLRSGVASPLGATVSLVAATVKFSAVTAALLVVVVAAIASRRYV